MNRKKWSFIIIFSLVFQLFQPFMMNGHAVAKAQKNQQHELPIKSVTPENGNLEVDPAAPLEIKLDSSHKNFKRYRQQFEELKYSLTVNDREVESLYDKSVNKLVVLGVTLDPNTDYSVDLKVKADKNNNKNKSENGSYSYEFTTKESYTFSKRLADKDGNVYEFTGNELVKEITLENDTTLPLSDIINEQEKVSIVSSPVSIKLPEEKLTPDAYINVKVNYKETPYGVGDYYVEDGQKILEWLPFSVSEEQETASFRLKESVTLIPFTRAETKVSSGFLSDLVEDAAEIVNLFKANKVLADDFNIRKMFNIKRNDSDGNFEAELTYLQNIDDSPFEIGNPEYYYKIYKQTGVDSDPSELVGVTEMEDDDLTIKKKLNNGVYQVKLFEDDSFSSEEDFADDLFWIQDIYIERSPRLMSQSEISEMARKYAPITVFQEDEQFFPISFEELLSADIPTTKVGDISNWFDGVHKGKDIPFHHLGEYLSYNGHVDYVINGKNALGLQEVTGSRENSTIYYSYIEQEGRKFLNYHMIYAFDPKTGTAADPGSGAHNYDRESITIELGTDNEAISISTSGHLPGQTMGLNGDDYSWTSSRLVMPFEDDSNLFPNHDNHPIIAIARGAHAVYPVQGTYDLSVPIFMGISKKGQELAGLTSDLTADDFAQRPIDHPDGRNILLPDTSDLSTSDFNQYTLKKLDFNQTSDSRYSYLNFSGDWVDVLASEVSSYSNEPFPPFTEKEKFVTDWIDEGDSGFNFNSIPQLNVNLREDVETYLSTYLTDADATLSGHVKDAITNQPIENAAISSLNAAHQFDKSLGLSDEEGNYRVQVESGENRNILISKNGYMPVEYQGITLEENEEKFLETILQIPSEYEGRTDGIIKGHAYRADNGGTIPGAVIKVRESFNSRSGEVLYETETGGDGSFLFEHVETGYYTLEISKDGYITTFINVTAIGGMEVVKQLLMSPALDEDEVRIVLEWGAEPSDLDSHLTGPASGGGEFHVFYGDKTYYEDGIVHAELDIDDVTSYGPETVTIRNLKNGVYHYYIHDYSNRSNPASSAMSNSSAKVKVYTENGYREFDIPVNQAGIQWNVFTIEDGAINPVNTIE
ncbi:carboxypeptidase regulatory-like domain-containing protein [Bacillus sp. Marseille-Q1617]|uniref:carboxypeptidase regulatory-like domain-containing protein n=1 Tax=Bacillus sp. Marseille-Q1617 TaxID=2736887 RepID=UPI00158B4AB5|nr:carboxypeptidase regulatory-like domain-containing protein [Bacillus sp. Marseille-Q1617]